LDEQNKSTQEHLHPLYTADIQCVSWLADIISERMSFQLKEKLYFLSSFRIGQDKHKKNTQKR
jgi:hypothetical protein